MELDFKYHHIGLITNKISEKEDYHPDAKFYASGYFESKYGIELLRFEEDSPLHPLIKTIPHIAFVVDDIKKAIEEKNVIHEISEPSPGVQICFVEENGIPVEFLQFNRPEEEIWPNSKKKDLEYHHFGVCTDTPKKDEIYLEHLNLSCTDHESNPFGLQWMRYEEKCTLPESVKKISHVAFKVNDVLESIKNKDVIIQPNSPSEGVLVAFIQENGMPIELIQID